MKQRIRPVALVIKLYGSLLWFSSYQCVVETVLALVSSQRYSWEGPTQRKGGPNNTKSAFLTYRTTHSAKISFLKMQSKVNFAAFLGSSFEKNFEPLCIDRLMVFLLYFSPLIRTNPPTGLRLEGNPKIYKLYFQHSIASSITIFGSAANFALHNIFGKNFHLIKK